MTDKILLARIKTIDKDIKDIKTSADTKIKLLKDIKARLKRNL